MAAPKTDEGGGEAHDLLKKQETPYKLASLFRKKRGNERNTRPTHFGKTILAGEGGTKDEVFWGWCLGGGEKKKKKKRAHPVGEDVREGEGDRSAEGKIEKGEKAQKKLDSKRVKNIIAKVHNSKRR